MDKKDYTEFLREGETLETVLIGTLRKRAFDARHKLTEEQRIAFAEARYEQDQNHRTMKLNDIRFWAENKFEARFTDGAETVAEETEIHRAWLKAFDDQPDVQEGETLRQLAKRVLVRWCRGQYGNGGDIYVAGFRPRDRMFTYEGFLIHNCGPTWFEENWVPPIKSRPGEADEPIDTTKLESWPNFGRVDVPKKLKPAQVAPPPSPVAFEVPRFTLGWGYTTANGPESNALAPGARKYLTVGRI
jgi:hypothetical protein